MLHQKPQRIRRTAKAEGSDRDGEHQDDHSDFLNDEGGLVEEIDSEDDSIAPEEEDAVEDKDEVDDEDDDQATQPSVALSPAAVPLSTPRSPSATPKPGVP